MYLFSIKDVKSGIFNVPFVSENAEVACRTIQTSLMRSNDSLLNMFPDDYILYQLGVFDNETGWIEHQELLRISSVAELLGYQKKPKELSNDNVVKVKSQKKK